MNRPGVKANRRHDSAPVAAEELEGSPVKSRRAEEIKSTESRFIAIVPVRSGYTRQEALRSLETVCRQIGVPCGVSEEGPVIHLSSYSSLMEYLNWHQGRDDFLILVFIVGWECSCGLPLSLKRGMPASEVLAALRESACCSVEAAIDAGRAELKSSFRSERVQQQRTWSFLNTPPSPPLSSQPTSNLGSKRGRTDEVAETRLWVGDDFTAPTAPVRYSFSEYFNHVFRVLVLMSRGFVEVPFATTIPSSLACQALHAIFASVSDTAATTFIVAFTKFLQVEGTQHINLDQWRSILKFMLVMDFPMLSRHRDDDGWPLLLDRFASRLRRGMLWY